MLDILLYWLFGIGSAYTVAIAPVIIASLIASGAAAGHTAYNSVQNNRLSRGQKQQNSFNAQQAALQREFEEHMFERELQASDTAFQRQTKDMLAAGVNPAILYGSGAGSGAPAASVGSGSAASGSYAPSNLGNVPNVGGMLMDLYQQQAEIDNIKADTNLKKSQTQGQDIDNANKPEYWTKQLALIGANKDEALANISKLEQDVRTGAADEALKNVNKNLVDKQITTVDLENTILAYKVGMTELDAKYYKAMKNLDLALKDAALRKSEEEIKNLRKTRALLQAQIVSEGSKSEMFKKNAKMNDEMSRNIHKKTTWIDAEELEKLINLSGNTDMLQGLARKYDTETEVIGDRYLFEVIETMNNLVSE